MGHYLVQTFNQIQCNKFGILYSNKSYVSLIEILRKFNLIQNQFFFLDLSSCEK